MTLIRLERRGELTPVRLLKGSLAGKVFYRRSDIDALVNGNDGTAPTTSTPREKLDQRHGGR